MDRGNKSHVMNLSIRQLNPSVIPTVVIAVEALQSPAFCLTILTLIQRLLGWLPEARKTIALFK